ncbi:hypothetical protein P12x_002893 [Tundrisphaera lichenicola]|uniref:hypothetical protein n=1 Tax=Tundrisphaera lichenicola TaxID=2029860 RepID=UPI003EBB2086
MSIAAILLMRENRLVETLRSAGATDPGAAKSLADLSGTDGLAMRRLRRHEVIREASEGRYYLDESSWTSMRATRRWVVAVVISIGLLVALACYYGFAR